MTRITALLLFSFAASFAPGALGRPNTHGPAISTWDSRASSVVFGYRRGLFGSVDLSALSFNSNFVSTSGVLNAQFGLHYISYRRDDAAPLARGVSAGGVALFSFPLDERYANGVPPTAFAFYLGAVPTALISGRLNFISVPGVIGLGLPWSPSPTVTLSPWLEISPGVDFDSEIRAVSTQEAVQAAMDGTLTRSEVEDLLKEGLSAELKTSLGKRAGLSAEFHLGDTVDLDANFALSGGSFSLGASFVLRWDDMVPGVRSSEAPSDREGCVRVFEQARACRARMRRPPVTGSPAAHTPAPQPQAVPPPERRPQRRLPATQRPQPSSAPGQRRLPAPPSAQPGRPQPKTRTRPGAPQPVPQTPAPRTPAAPTNDALPPLRAAPPLN